MGVVEENLQWVGGEVGEIVGREFFERRNEVIRGSLVHGSVFVGFEFMLSGEHIHEDRKDSRDRLEDDHEEHETSGDRLRSDSEGGVKLAAEGVLGICGHSEEEEDDGSLDDRDGHALHDVLPFEVTNFVSEDADEFIGGLAFDESVEESNLLAFAKAGEEGI